MNRNRIGSIVAIILLGSIAGHAAASPTCTRQPESQWLSETEMQKKIGQMGYKEIKVFKKTTSGCYEIYGRTADGRKAEVYFNPVTGAVVESNVD
ncbi:PepSY domain-containing protein [Burkholderia vietnamiensis]|jgi:hypothetical protein|uniref:PepSY domain-containing protein n=1 Tax=Burkholderia vietnamiensis TaxID=60552 RepID=UPI00075B0413|nr:PepSY domain-containing protein [Burkholderia vietnamiensis]KVE96294.1 hypothetical protein WJ01_10645 [Burkholderia vietnamiensis]MBR7918608.1 PepSY domain-containing protein [Burkholderia vietnamiensis]MCA8266178.1 PepSY domain-containing protein [Burkholderia vietnamiensis]MDN8035634.1 PepSY domain-containing protein [Burkholderia vietnamiensis]UKV74278.1 PepSY domain-containing protein [Burkholderia vietnamiensis]